MQNDTSKSDTTAQTETDADRALALLLAAAFVSKARPGCATALDLEREARALLGEKGQPDAEKAPTP